MFHYLFLPSIELAVQTVSVSPLKIHICGEEQEDREGRGKAPVHTFLNVKRDDEDAKTIISGSRAPENWLPAE